MSGETNLSTLLQSMQPIRLCCKNARRQMVGWEIVSVRPRFQLRSRDAQATKRFLPKTLNAVHAQEPRVINVDMVDKGVGV